MIRGLQTHHSSPMGAAQCLQEWLERPSVGHASADRAPAPDAPPTLYIAVVNQFKGDEADYGLIVALDEGRFPFDGIDTYGERCRWWVAISRARLGTSYLGVRANDAYWPPRRNRRPPQRPR